MRVPEQERPAIATVASLHSLTGQSDGVASQQGSDDEVTACSAGPDVPDTPLPFFTALF